MTKKECVICYDVFEELDWRCAVCICELCYSCGKKCQYKKCPYCKTGDLTHEYYGIEKLFTDMNDVKKFEILESDNDILASLSQPIAALFAAARRIRNLQDI